MLLTRYPGIGVRHCTYYSINSISAGIVWFTFTTNTVNLAEIYPCMRLKSTLEGV